MHWEVQEIGHRKDQLGTDNHKGGKNPPGEEMKLTQEHESLENNTPNTRNSFRKLTADSS